MKPEPWYREGWALWLMTTLFLSLVAVIVILGLTGTALALGWSYPGIFDMAPQIIGVGLIWLAVGLTLLLVDWWMGLRG